MDAFAIRLLHLIEKVGLPVDVRNACLALAEWSVVGRKDSTSRVDRLPRTFIYRYRAYAHTTFELCILFVSTPLNLQNGQ